MEGIGFVVPSSPASPMTGLPWPDQDSMAAPRQMLDSSPAATGTMGQPPMKAVHTSVPPLIEITGTDRPSPSCTHRKPDAGSGEPVEPTARSTSRGYDAPGFSFSLAQASR